MRANLNALFSISVTDTEYFNDEQEKFELVSCPIKGEFCNKIRPTMNKNYQESQVYRRNKMYQNSIDSLKKAYNMTSDLTEPACANCAEYFRSTINQSLKTIQNEKQKSSAGIFSFRLPKISFLKLENALKEI